MEKLTDIKKKLLDDKYLCLSTSSEKFATEAEFIDKIAFYLNKGIKIIRYGEKNKSPRDMIRLGRQLRQLCSEFGALLIIDSKIDIARILKADGVHLNYDDVEIKFAKDILGDDKIIGVSAFNEKFAKTLLESGANYVVIDVLKTDFKDDIEGLKSAFLNLSSPCYINGKYQYEDIIKMIDAGFKYFTISLNDESDELITKYIEVTGVGNSL